MQYCKACGSKMKEVGKYKDTRLFVCLECFSEKAQFIGKKECEHEYMEKSKNLCIHCGQPDLTIV